MAWRSCPGIAVAAADGGRLWLRRRRRLENLRAGARHEGDGGRASRAARRSWRITLITLNPKAQLVLGAHMLEICPSIAEGQTLAAKCIRSASAARRTRSRLVFDTPAGPALNASFMDMGNRFRLLVNEVDVVAPEKPMPKLPVARAVWVPKPNFEDGARCLDLRGRRASHRLQPGGHDAK